MKPKDSTMMDDGASPERITVSVAYETIGSKRLKMGFVTSGLGDVPDVFGPDQYIHHATVARMIEDEREACAAMIDCECANKSRVLAERDAYSAQRWRLCGEPSCGAIEAAAIRARGDKT